MKRTAFALAAILALGGSAIAAEGKDSATHIPPEVMNKLNNDLAKLNGQVQSVQPSPKSICHSIDEMKRAAPAGSKFVTLNAGQFHALVGAYVVLPPPSGLPDADGAILAQLKGKGGALVIWTKGGGTKPLCLANMDPMQIAEKFVAILKQINPGVGEKMDDASGDDVTL